MRLSASSTSVRGVGGAGVLPGVTYYVPCLSYTDVILLSTDSHQMRLCSSQVTVPLFSNDGVLGGDTAAGERGEEFGG